ncbi:acyl-CoA dehydrogenase family protein [Vogesella indigofera]|uniref:Acyl-CoA dehydrogenase family protein n=1 Tax=Vogesella indigofera TaxID=45465 RepID=A0ABT5I4N9_VOGIN|nr:acyl-CoA dehydrogenase family protein [Vogesella indigofera]MDC7691145.1 acyl-CoA dehydrogenase family protein [Vogesella indigofera]
MLLTTEQEQVVDAVRDFVQGEIAPHAAEWDKTHSFPRQALRGLGELGCFGLTVAPQWEGAGFDYVTLAAVIEEIAAGDGALSTIISVINSVGCGPIERFGNDWQKDTFLRPIARGEWISAFCLTEPDAGSDAAALRSRAVRDGDDYVINGVKQFITNGKHADVAIVFAVTDPAEGKKGISAFLVPTTAAGYTVAKVEDKLGQHASDTCQIVFDNMRVPASHLLGKEGEGYRIALANLESGRIGIAAQCLGMARAALDFATRYATERQTFGQAIIRHQAVGFRLAEAAARLEAARQLVRHAAALKDAGKPCLKESSMAKLVASEMAEAVCSAAIQTLGGYGYLSDYPLERIYRDVRVAQIYEGTSDVQKLVIARALEDEVR